MNAWREDSEAARATMLGMALGDALGWPVEFSSLREIRAKWGMQGITEPPDPALYTDDTQMSLAIAHALLEAGRGTLDEWMASVTRHFIEWRHDPTTAGRAPGNACLAGVDALERGASWRDSGRVDSKGCGACMRVAPIGIFFRRHPERLIEFAIAQGRSTHRHVASDAACVAGAYAVKLALDQVSPEQWIGELRAVTRAMSVEFDDALARLELVLAAPHDESSLERIGPLRGGGWIAEEAIAMALYCVLRHPDDYVAAVRLAVNIAGDSDSVGAIAGGIGGARLGLDAIPKKWLARLENRAEIERIAIGLAESAQ